MDALKFKPYQCLLITIFAGTQYSSNWFSKSISVNYQLVGCIASLTFMCHADPFNTDFAGSYVLHRW